MTRARASSVVTPAAATLLTVNVLCEQDVVAARQGARQLAEYLGFDRQDQVRIATAVSEITRNALQYATGGHVEFSLDSSGSVSGLGVVVSDSGPGIAEVQTILDGRYHSNTGMGLGIMGARRLMDWFGLESAPGRGVIVRMGKYLPRGTHAPAPGAVAGVAARFRAFRPNSPLDELQVQNYQLVKAIDDLKQREDDVRRLNQELEDTNRGVMALYAELDDKAASLRQADELKSRFLSHVSHEFRTPLNSILALAGLLVSRVDGQLTPEQDKQIDYIRKAAEDLTEIVNDLLDLAKVEAGKTVVHAAPFSVSSLFGALRGMMRPLQSQGAVELIIEDADPALVVNTDESKVAQILRNLVSNALKFTERGEVRVSVQRVDGELMFVVSDTGIGIPAEHQDRIFQEFTQIDHPLQRTVKGTGLGLPLSRKLAELLGGSLTVSSELGQGSTFSFKLPTHVVAPQQHTCAATDRAGDGLPPHACSNTLLVIDDDEVARYLVRQFLRGSDIVVEEADSGTTGLDRARFDSPRAILLDLSMPDMGGFQVLSCLREDPETASIPVMIYTSRTLTASDRERIAQSASGIVHKQDLTREKFVCELRKVIGEFSTGTGQ